jgi:hypothetical protein
VIYGALIRRFGLALGWRPRVCVDKSRTLQRSKNRPGERGALVSAVRYARGLWQSRLSIGLAVHCRQSRRFRRGLRPTSRLHVVWEEKASASIAAADGTERLQKNRPSR